MAGLNDKELDSYRDLIRPASTFDDGFGWKSLMGSFFVALVMLPASMYMALAIGESVGSAAKWVTVILFLEMAKRARTALKPAEILILFALVGTLISGPTQSFFWRQYIVQSEAARSFGLSGAFPAWYAPGDAAVLDTRSFLHWEWFVPLILLFVSQAIARLDSLVLGYGLFRITSDVEKLPFPMAPLGAAGVTALSENQTGTEGWRWRTFSIGTALGLAFGGVYIALPVITSALGFASPFHILPIPWLDTSTRTQDWLPATPTGITFDMSHFFLGMALPFFGVLGAFIGVALTVALNPLLHMFGWLPTWKPGMRTPEIIFSNHIDFYLSFGIGLAIAIAAIGIWQCVATLRKRNAGPSLDGGVQGTAVTINAGRGDIRWLWIILTYLISSAFYILLCGWLLDWDFRGSHLLWVLLFFAFVYTPLISYVTARLEGLAGQAVDLPFIREAAFILSGYKGVEVWLLPVPMHNYGAHDTVQYRTAELLGCSFRSIWRMAIVTTPLVFVMSLVFGEFIWSLGPIPGPAYPYAQEMWDLNARNQCLVWSSTLSGYSPFLEALRPDLIAGGGLVGLALYAGMSALGLPILLMYGLIKGLGGSPPQTLVTELLGALFGKFVMARRFGEDRWRQFAPVLFAGYACGAGLIAMFALGLKFLSAAVFQLPY